VNVATRLRLVLGAELVAYYFAAPYIILLGLDEKRGLFDPNTSMNLRLAAYTLLVGIYPLLQILIAPYVGRRLDQGPSKISVLRKVHLANSLCYLFLGLSAYLGSFPLALLALTIPGLTGCAAPIGKSLIASITDPEARVKEFAKLAFIKGIVKLIAPLCGVALFQWVVGKSSYVPFFCVSSAISLCCFFFSFSFAKASFGMCVGEIAKSKTTLHLFVSIFKKNQALFFVFVFLLTGYSVFVKFTPLIIFEKLGEQPMLVNYLSSLVGLAYSLNQLFVVHFSKPIESVINVLFASLCACTLLLSFSGMGPLWFVGLFGILFCFSVLATCIEARLSLQGVYGNPGTVQGVLYSMENWSLLLAPVIGSIMASQNTLYPLYFVTSCALFSAFFFTYTQSLRAVSNNEIKL